MELKKREYTEDEVMVVAAPSSLHLNADLADAAKERWQRVIEKAKANGQEVWDDPMQRFEGVAETANGLELRMSQTKFSTRFALRGMLDDGETTIKSLGAYVHCLTRTSDGWYVFGKKSGKYVSDYAFSFIGGVLDYDGDRPRTPFEVARTELNEEAGVANEDIESLQLVGMYESDHGSIGITIATQLHLDKAAMQRTFAHKTDKELAGLEYVQKEEVTTHMRNVLKRGEAEIATIQRYLEGEV